MKYSTFFFNAFIILICNTTIQAQNINWQGMPKEKTHVMSLSFGLEHGAVYSLGYGYQIHKKTPLLLNMTVSLPAGNQLVDDFKVRIGGQQKIFGSRNFLTTAKVYGVFRRFDNDFARFLNFGSEFAIVTGYYRPRWFVAGEFGFDKAIVTHIQHSDLARDYYNDIKNGWYIPSGGNFFCGIQGGLTFAKNDLTLNLGKYSTQYLNSGTTLPFYAQLGYNLRFH